MCLSSGDVEEGDVTRCTSYGHAGKTTKPEDRMRELIGLQKSNGMFELSSEDWIDSVFEVYTGNYVDVQSSCPTGVAFNLWITALAIKIMEIKMSETKELWELVLHKSKERLNIELKKNEKQCQMLLNKAEERIKIK